MEIYDYSEKYEKDTVKSKEKKQNLQKKFLEKLKKKEIKADIQEKTKENLEENNEKKYELEKQRRKEVEKKTKKLEKKTEVLKEELTVEKEKSEKISLKLRQRTEEKNHALLLLEQMKKKNEELEKQLKEANEHKQTNEDRELKAKIKELEKKSSKQHKIHTEVIRKNQIYKTQIKSLENKMKIERTLKEAENDKKNEVRLKSLLKELDFHKTKIKELKESLDVKTLIKLLKEQLDGETVSEYATKRKNPIMEIALEVEEMKKVSRMKKAEEKKQYKAVTTDKTGLPKVEIIFGYVSKVKEKWLFFTINMETYEIMNPESLDYVKNDSPTKGLLKEGKVFVKKTYALETPSMKKAQIAKHNKTEKQKDKQEYIPFGKETVLIVGSRNQSTYVNRLQNHGLQVLWHNPFEESYERLSAKYKKADLTIVCTSHISHSALEHIQKGQPHVELIERDNEELIAARVRYALLQLRNQKEEGIKPL